jgi:predicted nucleic acid-binding protein
LEVRSVTAITDGALQSLDEGERAAITLGLYVHADLILIDERKGASVTGVLGVLELAARRDLINLADTFTRLKATNFRYRQSILDEILSRCRAGETGEHTA